MKRKTIILDIDGLIVKHLGQGAIVQWDPKNMSLCPNVHPLFDYLESQSMFIVLMTARPEQWRYELETWLWKERLMWDRLIMGVGHGLRILVNDTKPAGSSALAIETERNADCRTLIERLKQC